MAKCQNLMNKLKTDSKNNHLSIDTIWEETCTLRSGGFVGGIIFLFPSVLLLLMLIFIFPFGALLFGIPLLILSFSCIYNSNTPLIRFTNSELIVRNNDLKRKKHFLLSQIKEIHIIIIKRKVYCKNGTYYAYSKFKFNILTLSREYRYKFYWGFYEATKFLFKGYSEAKQKAIEKRSEFERALKNLEKIFPDLIDFIDLVPPEKSESGWIGILCLIGICILVGISIFFWS